jgi:glucose/arabinose dehydrogenase
LLCVAIDPEFEQNRYVYLYYSRPGDPVVNTTVRYTERDGIGTEPQVIFEAPVVTGAGNHNGGNLHFGPDGKLYISIGENARPAFAQERDSLYGKIHRINPDGSVPADNPFAPAPGWVYGLRNPFDFTFDPLTGSLWATDNGPACDDELHVVQAGENGGWGPDYQCGQVPANTSAPVLRWSDTEAVTGVTIYNQETIPAWNGSLFVCAYSSGKLYRATLNAERTTITAVYQVELPGDARCRTDITPAPDGSIYIGDPPHIHRIVGQ